MPETQTQQTASKKMLTLALMLFYVVPITVLGWSAGGLKGAGFGVLLAVVGAGGLNILWKRGEDQLRDHASRLVELKVRKLVQQQALQVKPGATETLVEENEKLRESFEEERRRAQGEEEILREACEEAKQRELIFEKEVGAKAEELQGLKETLEQAEQRIQDMGQGTESYQKEVQAQLSKKEALLLEYQHTMAEQRGIIEKKQEEAQHLEGRIHDLMYEVRTLVQLEGVPEAQAQYHAAYTAPAGSEDLQPLADLLEAPGQAYHDIEELYHDLPVSAENTIHTNYDAIMHLHRYTDIAQQLTGVSHLGGESPRFLDLSLDSYAIDQRRLFDKFHGENSCVILVYSQKEQRLLFVNNQIQSLLGWNPETFVKDFESIVQKGLQDWHNHVTQLEGENESKLRLLMRAASGEDSLVRCYLGRIDKGPFNAHLIGVLFQAEN